MAGYHEDDIRQLLKNVFDLEGGIGVSGEKLISAFSDLEVDIYFTGDVSEESIESIDVASVLSLEEKQTLINGCME